MPITNCTSHKLEIFFSIRHSSLAVETLAEPVLAQ